MSVNPALDPSQSANAGIPTPTSLHHLPPCDFAGRVPVVTLDRVAQQYARATAGIGPPRVWEGGPR